MTKRDYYEILGIERNATKHEVKMAYKKLARKYHPDVAENKEEAEIRFREINEAYAVLSDDEKKATYDQFGHGGLSGAGFGGSPFDADFGDGGFGDIFDMFFGSGMGGRRGRPRGPQPVRGRDVRKDIEIDLEEAFRGVEMDVDVQTYQKCPVCYGRRVKPGSGYRQCSQCQGQGAIRNVQNTMFGQFVTSSTCSACQGSGQIPEELCEECKGQGKTISRRKITVTVPPGIEEGQRIKIPGEGEAGEYSGPSGDLYIFVFIREHEQFNRRGADLFVDLPIGFADAALGTSREIEVFGETVKIEIDGGTQSETVITKKGKGMPRLRGDGRGDLHAKVKVVTPTKLTKKQRDLLCQFADEGPQFHCEKKGFLGKIFDAITGKA